MISSSRHRYELCQPNVFFAISLSFFTIFAAVPMIEVLLGETLSNVVRHICVITFFVISPILSCLILYKHGNMKKMFSEVNFLVLLVGSFMILIPIFVYIQSIDVYNKYPFNAILYGCFSGGVCAWIFVFVGARDSDDEKNDDTNDNLNDVTNHNLNELLHQLLEEP